MIVFDIQEHSNTRAIFVHYEAFFQHRHCMVSPCKGCPRRAREASDPTPPAQIQACGFPAPGSSVRGASALPVIREIALLLREVGLWTPARPVRPTLLVRTASHRHPAA